MTGQIVSALLGCLAVAIITLGIYGIYCYGELKGYERGLDDAEEIWGDVHEELRGYGDNS